MSSFYSLLLVLLCSSSIRWAQADSSNSTNTSSTTTVSPLNVTSESALYADVHERSLQLSDLPRQGRIINDEKISIKGFIPIVGLSEDSVKSGSSERKPERMDGLSYMEKYMKNAMASSSNGDEQYSSGQVQDNLPQHVAQPEDQRFIGAALQGLLGNMGGIRKSGYGHKQPSINRKSDCVCVPFYMCKNGYLAQSATSQSSPIDLSSMYGNMAYEQRRGDDQFASASSAVNTYKAPTSSNDDQSPYLPINERSIDNLNETKFTEEILGRMLGGKSMSDGCGLLRTCCQRSYPNQMIPSDGFSGATAADFSQMMPELMNQAMLNNPNYQQQYQQQQQTANGYPVYKPSNNAYQKPGGYYNPKMRPPPSSVLQSMYSPQRGGYRPPKLINSPSHHEAMFEAPLPVPVRNDPNYGGLISGMGGSMGGLGNMGSMAAAFAYDKCGTRQSIGINGRVQNLNYHESSTEFGEFPWQVAILKKLGPSDNLYVCGGALISSNFIITAAHCIKKFQPKDLKIRLGEWDVHREDEFYPYIEKNVDEIIVHPHFSPRNLANDVAILQIDSEIDFSQHPHISPICLTEPFEVLAGHRCYVSGWGKNSFGTQGEYQSVLMKVDLPILETRLCEGMLRRTKLGHNFRLDRSMICAGGEHGKDACEGDGGSGLVCDVNGTWKVAGLVSWGLGCGSQNVPGVYTNIAQIRPWVDKVVLPYYAALMQSKSNEQKNNGNFNELISERSLGGGSSQNGTTTTSITHSSPSTFNTTSTAQ